MKMIPMKNTLKIVWEWHKKYKYNLQSLIRFSFICFSKRKKKIFLYIFWRAALLLQAMSIKDVAAQSVSWPVSKPDDEPEKKCENSEGEV